jgi:hypothetical protein
MEAVPSRAAPSDARQYDPHPRKDGAQPPSSSNHRQKPDRAPSLTYRRNLSAFTYQHLQSAVWTCRTTPKLAGASNRRRGIVGQRS